MPKPPETWDEMIAMAKKLPAGEGNILEQGQKYEGYVVWFNNLVASRRRRSSTPKGDPTLDAPAVKAAQIIKDVADVRARRPVALDRRRRTRRGSRFEAGKGAFLLNWPYVYAAARTDAKTSPVDEEGLREHGLRALARRQQGRAEQGLDRRRQPGHPELRASTRSSPTQAALCMTSAKWQDAGGHQRGPAAGHERAYDDPKVQKAYPFADLLREQLEDAVPRPGDARLHRRLAGDPGDAAPAGEHRPAEGDQHAEGPARKRSPTEGCSDGRRRDRHGQAAAPPRRGERGPDRPRQGRAQARLDAVRAGGDRDAARRRAIPIVYAFWLSLQRYDLRFPDDKEFVGLSQLRRRAHLEHLVARRLATR